MEAEIKAITQNIDPSVIHLLNDKLLELNERKEAIQDMASRRSESNLNRKSVVSWCRKTLARIHRAAQGLEDSESTKALIEVLVKEIVIDFTVPNGKGGTCTITLTEPAEAMQAEVGLSVLPAPILEQEAESVLKKNARRGT